MTTASQWLRHAKAALDAADVESARLDAELLLMHAWQVDRTQHQLYRFVPSVVGAVAVKNLVAMELTQGPAHEIADGEEFIDNLFLIDAHCKTDNVKLDPPRRVLHDAAHCACVQRPGSPGAAIEGRLC